MAALNDEELLRPLGDTGKFRFENIFNTLPDDEEPNIFRTSPYFSVDGMPTSINTNNNNFSVLSLNSQSIRAKFDSLQVFLATIANQNIEFDVICLQETWLKNDFDTSLLNIEGYNVFSEPCRLSSHGGLLIYVKDTFNVSKIDINTAPSTFEILTVKINSDCSQRAITLTNIYRPPRNNANNNITKFIEELDIFLNSLEGFKGNAIVTGDFNINILKIKEDKTIADFLDRMLSLGFFPKITLPTRVCNTSASLIDNMYCKLSSESLESYSGIIFSDISDHFPYFISIKNIFKPKPYSNRGYVKARLNTPSALANFLNDLSNQDIESSLVCLPFANPDKNCDILINKITESKEKHLPFKFEKFNKYKHKAKKWITSGIIKSIKYRDGLYRKMKKYQNDPNRYDILKANLNILK